MLLRQISSTRITPKYTQEGEHVTVPGALKGKGGDPDEEGGGKPDPGFWAIAGI